MKRLAKAITALSTILSTVALSSAKVAAYSYSSTDDAAATGLAALFTGGMIIIPLCCGSVFFLLWIAVAYFVYKDAKKNNIDNPILWAIIVWFTGIIGILIYLLAVRNKDK